MTLPHLTDYEKERVTYFLGYPTQTAASIQFGTARPVQTAFLVQLALAEVDSQGAIDRIRKCLHILTDIEAKIEAATCSLQVEAVGGIKMRGADEGKTYPDLLEREFVRWAGRLADILGVPFYPFSLRFAGVAGGGVNIPVK